MNSCKNCDTSFDGFFCPQCGQKLIKGRLSIKDASLELLDLLTNVEQGLWFTIKHLFTQPGTVIKEYIEGKRKKYFAPFKLVLLTTTASLLIAEAFRKFSSPIEPLRDDAPLLEVLFTKYPSIGTLMSIPFLALALKIVFRKKGYNYTELLVFAAYLLSIINLIAILFEGPSLILPETVWISIVAFIIIPFWFNLSVFGGKKTNLFFNTVISIFLWFLLMLATGKVVEFIIDLF